MRSIWRLLRLLTYTLAYTLYFSIAALFVHPEERPRFRAYHQRRGCVVICRILRLRVHVVGNLSDHRNLLVVSNHFGVIDPLVLASQFEVSFVGKAELRKWPLVGWVTRQVGVIFVERERRLPVHDFVAAVRARLRSGVPVLVFPEGTTSEDETVRPFKTGSFASVAGMESGGVLPAYLKPTRVNGRPAVGEARRLVTWAGGDQTFVQHLFQLANLESAEIEIRVGDPIPTRDAGRKELAEQAYSAVVNLGFVVSDA